MCAHASTCFSATWLLTYHDLAMQEGSVCAYPDDETCFTVLLDGAGRKLAQVAREDLTVTQEVACIVCKTATPEEVTHIVHA